MGQNRRWGYQVFDSPILLFYSNDVGDGFRFHTFIHLDSRRFLGVPTNKVPLIRRLYRLGASDMWRGYLVRKIAL